MDNALREDVQAFARQAGDTLLKDFRKRQDTGRFHGKDAKSYWDQGSERLITGLIRKKYPDHAVLAEESGMHSHGSRFLWVVDPLDGTANFINCNPFFSVSMAVQVDSETILAAIYAPFLGEMYFAERGKGALLNGKRINVSEVSDIQSSYVVTCEGGERSKERIAKIRYAVSSKVMDLRKIGSAALECAWVATGRADAFVSMNMPPWDVAAGVLLVQEAGGKVTDFSGKAWKLAQMDFLVTNGKVHESLRKLANP